jgi:hypothetical protein
MRQKSLSLNAAKSFAGKTASCCADGMDWLEIGASFARFFAYLTQSLGRRQAPIAHAGWHPCKAGLFAQPKLSITGWLAVRFATLTGWLAGRPQAFLTESG